MSFRLFCCVWAGFHEPHLGYLTLSWFSPTSSSSICPPLRLVWRTPSSLVTPPYLGADCARLTLLPYFTLSWLIDPNCCHFCPQPLISGFIQIDEKWMNVFFFFCLGDMEGHGGAPFSISPSFSLVQVPSVCFSRCLLLPRYQIFKLKELFLEEHRD